MTGKKQSATDEKDQSIEFLKKTCEELLRLLGLTGNVSVSFDVENDAYLVDIQSDDAALLIGNRGRTLYSLQNILSLAHGAQFEWKRVVVNVADWREKENTRLVKLAQTTAQRARETNEVQSLYNLTPSQRRVIHMALSSEKGVTTESQGEGKDRFLLVLPKK